MANTMASTTGAESSVSATASQVGSVASEEVKAVAQDAKLHVKRVVGESRETVRAEAENQAGRMAATLRDVGEQLRAMAQGQGASGIAVDLSQQLADTATRAASRLETGGIEATMGDLKRFARQRPGMFLLGALGAGFAAGRMIKSVDTHALIESAKPGHGSDGADQQPPALASGGYSPATAAVPPAAIDLIGGVSNG